MITFTVTNKKGGVGKTTIAANLAQALALCGHKVLAIDNDEQHNLTKSLGLKTQKYDISHLYDITHNVKYDEYAKCVICKTMVDGADCLPSSSRLANIEIAKQNRLQSLISCDTVKNQYDYCIIDCSPGIRSKENDYAVEVADILIIPIEMKQFSLDAAYEMANIVINQYGKSKDDILIIPNKYKNTQKHKVILEAIRTLDIGHVTDTVISYDENLDSVITDRKAFLLSSSCSKATLNLINILKEIFPIEDVEEKINTIRMRERLRKNIENLKLYREKKLTENCLVN